MGEPEGLIAEGARLATIAARDLWLRVRPPGEPPVLPLGRVRRRLELLLVALHGVSLPIIPADPAPAPTWLARLLGRAPRHLRVTRSLAATDGLHVWLPRELDATEGDAAALEQYRVLTLEQGMRAGLGFAGAHRTGAAPVERDLYRLAEAAAVDRILVRTAPGLREALAEARRRGAAERPSLERLSPAERAVERLLRELLAADAATPPPGLAAVVTPDDARKWAGAAARRAELRGRYRGLAPVALWGEVRLPTEAGAAGARAPAGAAARPPRAASLRQAPRARRARDDEDDTSPGTWMVRLDDPMQSVEDPMGLQRPADQDAAADPAELADALAELPEARMVRTPDAAREVLASDTARRETAGDEMPGAGAGGIAYPEWDHRRQAYRHPGAIVRPALAREGTGAWVEQVRDRHAALIRRVRRRFDGLRPRRTRLGRQADGPDLDLAAYVSAFAEGRAGVAGDDRLYAAQRPARRDLAIAVLADVSASTDAWVAGAQRIVDVEKEALAVLLEALEVLGDRHALLAFWGEGPQAVHVVTVKAFDEPSGASARRRLAALEPDGYTRVGAAVRHASALLGRERARHRLLLLLSDGKPNDVDEYAGRYGIEDTRQAVAEARLAGLVPYCLTVDREAPAYLPYIFGPGGFAVLPRPALLPAVLVEALRLLVRR